MPLIRRLDHVAHGSGIKYGTRHLAGGRIHFRPKALNGGMIHTLRYGKRFHKRYGVSAGGIMARQGGALPDSETIPTPYNVQLPGGRMKRSREMTKEHVIARMAKLSRS